jgi:hypothetical protein
MELIAKNEDLLKEVVDQRQTAQDLLDSGIKHQQVLFLLLQMFEHFSCTINNLKCL